MATRTFTINSVPHEAVIGDVTILFQPEAVGAEFAEAYDKLRAAQKKVSAAEGGKPSSTKHAKGNGVDSATLIELSSVMREFIARFVLPESRDAFDSLKLPDRVLVALIEYVAELYGGGSGNPAGPGGTSSG